MIRVGLVGCGQMGEVHLQLVKNLKGVQIVGVADPNLARARALASREKIDVVAGGLESLLELARPDAVHIVTPPVTHAPLACTALRAGCHVFVEKPMALTVQEAESVLAAVEPGRILTVGHNHLFDPVIREARARVAEGHLGQLVGLDAFHGMLPVWPAWLTELPSGPWMNDSSHLLYLSQSFMGDPLAIRAMGHPTTERSKIMELRVVAQHAGGMSSLAFSSGTVPFRLRLTLFGTKRTLEADLIAGTLVEARPFSGHRWLTKGLSILDVTSQLLLGAGRNAVRVLTGREGGWPGLRALLDAFYTAIREGGVSPVPATQGARVVQLLEEIQRLLRPSPDR
jgi:predicted dehydrogenase